LNSIRLRNHIVVDIDRREDDGDLAARMQRFGLQVDFVYAPVSPLRESEWSRWTQVLPAYLRAARQSLVGMQQHDHLIFLAATGLALAAANACWFYRKRAPKISVLNFIYRRRFGPVGSLLDFVVKRALAQMNFIGVPSREAAEAYCRRFPKAASQFQVFPTWCGFPETEPRPVPSSIPIFSGGRSMRDYKTLFEALRLLEVPATIAASKIAVEGLDIPKKVTLHFDVSEQTFADLMTSAAVVVVPLQLANFDAGQSVVQQAMCYGKPVIATRTAGLTEYLDHGKTGFLVPPADPEALAAAMKNLLENAALASAIGAAARRIYEEHYSRDAFVKRLASTFCGGALAQ
jgi:hypothetical protein